MNETTMNDLDGLLEGDDQIEIVAFDSSDVPAVMLCTYEF